MTTQAITTERQRALIEKLTRLVASRAKEEVEIRQRGTVRAEDSKREYEQQRDVLTAEFEGQHAKLVQTYRESREAVYFNYESQGHALLSKEHQSAEDAAQEQEELIDEAKNLWKHRCQLIQERFAEQELVPKTVLSQFEQQCHDRAREVQVLVTEAQQIVRRRCDWPGDAAPVISPPTGLSTKECAERVALAFRLAHEKLQLLRLQPAAKFLEDGWPVLIFIFGTLALAYPAWLWLGTLGWIWVLGACLVVPLVIALSIRFAVRPFARRQTLRVLPEFRQAAGQIEAYLGAALQAANADAQRSHQQVVERRDNDLQAANAEWDRSREEQVRRGHSRIKKSAAEFQTRRLSIEETHERQLQQIESEFPGRIQRLEQDFERRMAELSDTYRQRRAAYREQFEREWSELNSRWAAGVKEFQAEADAMQEFCGRHFPPWQEIDGKTWRPSAVGSANATTPDGRNTEGSLSALQFGQYAFDLEKLEGGLPSGGEWEMPRTTFQLPAVLSYPNCPSLLLEAEGDGRDVATHTIQNVMLRLLTSFPPGKVRFTIIDPVGLGQNFSAFMHLADYNERLVTSRIWTESAHVNQRLADLTEHMENVIQKYLRNEFASIQEYNEHAGEVAEPFQILVVANFPANFSDEAARRLVSIANSGARCGVYTLISTDTRLKLPRNFDLPDLESQAATLVWDSDQRRFCWQHPDLHGLPLTLESPPDDDRFTEIVRAVGRFAKDAARVEVPFESILPPADQWWAADSRSEIEVPLGRAGAKKLQYMRLGKGTSQHVLIAGKTGSGKSTLLNAMITSLAVYYSPDELQFYLIDFKKGVEFKAYATFRLPHARVIAIESEREFGMSVLERLDLELKRRGDLFRKHGVQDVKGYRQADPQAVMPRILLVIDEFQEFFTSDDKISHDSALLLDRLVRQGRAFGIHVLLGSQTLAGAYSLARSTIGQMAVRIALQCSESDAHLILSEDNTAARLLSRPGEAIYNDANGLFEGNHPFQVVWLSDHQREGYLRELSTRAGGRAFSGGPPTIFEGNVAADPGDNELLQKVLHSPASASSPLAPRIWLGAAVAIKDPTDVVFRRQNGGNLLIVGQQAELALGILANSVMTLSAQLRPSTAGAAAQGLPDQGLPDHATSAAPLRSFYVLDGARPDSPEAGFWNRLTDRVTLDCEIVPPRDAARIVRSLAEEVDRRLAAGDQASEPIFMIIDNLSRFRDLKKSDDFGMSSFDDEGGGSVDKQLTSILREGPPVGIHTLLWCDSFNNLNRWVERQTLRDLEMRVLFQMSVTDSSNLMDSPAASRLGTHMAIYFSEERGQAEKFRPYGLPTANWLAWVDERLSSRSGTPENLDQATARA